MDHLINAILLNGVGVAGAGSHQIGQLLAGTAGVAIKKVLADEISSAVLLEGFDGSFVHVEDDAGWITNGDGHLDL
ncbi:hypothetical protein SDC9_127334 [bioreactor metagenome]|uniref:Uncharacterized protein n=1 Tax=bioreactor metagenome TaxID=1076179 RepID=A0A645CTN9_9ZZZZ